MSRRPRAAGPLLLRRGRGRLEIAATDNDSADEFREGLEGLDISINF